jgi:hypothetical protein
MAASTLTANPRSLPMPVVAVCGLAIVVGVIAFVAGLNSDPDTAWRAFHVNYLYLAGLSQGGLVLACALVIVGAKWAGPIRHVAEGLAAWVPMTLVLFAISFFGREAIYTEWIHGAPHGKEPWLNIPRLYITDLSILAVLTVLTLTFLKTSIRPALHGAAERASAAKGLFSSWTAKWKGDEEERAASEAKLKVLAPIICLVFAFGYGIIAVDQVMSLTPTWFSNIFGWYFAWGGFLSAVAATAFICVLLRNSPGWQGEITPSRLHDLGKMCFAFSIFWMYLFFSQYIVIWYGNLPEETQFIQARLGTQFMQDTWLFVASRLEEPYVQLSMTVWAANWIIPFTVLLGQRPKRTPAILGTVSFGILVGFWLERNALVWPSLVPEDGSAWIGAIQFGIAAGFIGAFVLTYLVFSRIFPTLPVPKHS